MTFPANTNALLGARALALLTAHRKAAHRSMIRDYPRATTDYDALLHAWVLVSARLDLDRARVASLCAPWFE